MLCGFLGFARVTWILDWYVNLLIFEFEFQFFALGFGEMEIEIELGIGGGVCE